MKSICEHWIDSTVSYTKEHEMKGFWKEKLGLN